MQHILAPDFSFFEQPNCKSSEQRVALKLNCSGLSFEKRDRQTGIVFHLSYYNFLFLPTNVWWSCPKWIVYYLLKQASWEYKITCVHISSWTDFWSRDDICIFYLVAKSRHEGTVLRVLTRPFMWPDLGLIFCFKILKKGNMEYFRSL